MNTALTQKEISAILRILLFLAKVDGEISDNEFRLIKELKAIHHCYNFNIVEEFNRLPTDIRLIFSGIERRVAKQYLVKILIHFCYYDGSYSAVERLTIYHIAEGLGEKSNFVSEIEKQYAHEAQKAIEKYAQEHSQELGENINNFSWQNIAMTTGLVIGGGAALAATGGLIAPVVGGIVGSSLFGLTGAAASSAGLAALGGGAVAAGGGGMAAGGAIVSSLLGLTGMGLGAKTGFNLFGGLEEFEIVSLTKQREACHQILCIHGFMQQEDSLERIWNPVANFDFYSDIYGLRWESKTLKNWGNLLQQVTLKVGAGQVAAAAAASATRAAGGLVALPVAIASAFSLIDNPWHVARNKAEIAGQALAQKIMNLPSPISLLGYSLGSRVIAYTLKYLAKEQCYGKVFNIYFMGGAVGKDHPIFRHHYLDKVVANNIYNFYSQKDLVLTYLYQAAEFGDQPIGLMPIESTRINNIDVTSIIDGHLKYPQKLDRLLEYCYNQPVKETIVTSNKTPTDKAIKILKDTPGMTEADPRDFTKGKYFCHLSDGSIVTRWINNFNVHHVFVVSTTGDMVFGGFVGWIHTDALLQALESIEHL